MNEAPDAERQPSGYVRLPWPLVGAGLFLVLAALLGFGLFANRNLRPQTVAAPTAVVVEPATPTSVPVIAAPQAETPTPEAQVIVTTTAATATPAPGAATGTATAIAAPAATPRPTVNPELAAEVGNAYKQYWQVRAEALYELDSSRLPEVMAGDHLIAAEDLIAQLRSESRAILTDVTHNYVVMEATESQAAIADEYTDDSTYVDSVSHQSITRPVGAVVKEEYHMDKIDGIWRVVSLARAT